MAILLYKTTVLIDGCFFGAVLWNLSSIEARNQNNRFQNTGSAFAGFFRVALNREGEKQNRLNQPDLRHVLLISACKEIAVVIFTKNG